MDYATFKSTIAKLAVDDETDAEFLAMFPRATEYGELRIARDLDLLSTVGTSTSVTTTINNPLVTFTRGDFVTLQGVNVITPSTATTVLTGARNPLQPVSKDFLYFAHGSSANAGVPKYYAMIDDHSFMLGPWPSAAYTLEIVGTVRQTPLSADNTTTFISTYLPDLLTMAAMIYVSGWQRNYGKQADDPQQAMSYEGQYQALLKSAAVEEARRKFQASGWTSMSPPVAASPTR